MDTATTPPDVIADLLADLRSLEAANEQRAQALATRGTQINLDSVLRLRLALLADALLGAVEGEYASAMRLEYELRVQEELSWRLNGVEQQAAAARARALLTAPGGVPAGPSLIVPGR